MYPRVIVDKNNSKNISLAIFKDRHYFYYFDLNKTFSDFNKTGFDKDILTNKEKNCSKLDYTKLIIAILKDSSFTETKNIELKKIDQANILTKENSIEKLILNIPECKKSIFQSIKK